MRRAVRLVAAVFAAFLAISAAKGQGLEKPKLTIGVGGKPLIYYLPLTIAERNGYFKQEGLDVEIQDFPGGARALQALLGGSVDIVSGAYEHTISQQAKGQAIQALVLQGQYSGIVLALPKAKAAAYKSPADLKGMKIGVTAPGSSTNMFVNILLAKANLKPDDVSIIGVGAGAGAVAIMKRGEIDALSNLDPVIAQLVSDGTVTPVVDTRTEKGMKEVYGGAYAAGCIYAPPEWVKKNPHTAQAVVSAMVHALRFIQHASIDEIVAAVPPEYYTDKALYKKALEDNIASFKHDGFISKEAGEHVAHDLLTFDPTMKGKTIVLPRTVDMSFQQKAAQTIK